MRELRPGRALAERLGAPVYAPPADTASDLMQKYGVTAEQADEGAPTSTGCDPRAPKPAGTAPATACRSGSRQTARRSNAPSPDAASAVGPHYDLPRGSSDEVAVMSG
jgi:hypothetical protein